MPIPNGLTNRRVALSARAIMLHLTILTSGLGMTSLGMSHLTAVLTPSYVLFRATDEELVDAINQLKEKASELHLQDISREAARTLLLKDLMQMRKLLLQVPLKADID